MSLDLHRDITLRAMVMMMLADGKVVYPELELIGRIYRDLTDAEPEDGLLDRVAEEIGAETRSVEEYLGDATADWKPSGRRSLLRAACLVSVADQELVRDERIMLIRFGRALRLSAQDVRSIHHELCGDPPI